MTTGLSALGLIRESGRPGVLSVLKGGRWSVVEELSPTLGWLTESVASIVAAL